MVPRATSLLQNAYRKGRLSHAIILSGPDREGVEGVAHSLAAHLLGLSDGGDPLQHPDCFLVRPENKMRQIPVDAVRGLIRNIAHTSSQGANKVALMLDAERMNPAASNAFLKSLEEPPPGSYLLLCSTRLQDFSDTIRSRCLNVRVEGHPPSIQHPDWKVWEERFAGWLNDLETPLTKRSEVTARLIGGYGLVRAFLGIEETIAAAEWESARTGLPEETPDEAAAAVEAGIRRGTRQRLLAAIAEILNQRTREQLLAASSDHSRLVTRLKRGHDALEDTSRLLHLNLTPVAALESFILSMLRLWTAPVAAK